MIDDADCFDGCGGYPTLFELYNIVATQFPGYEMQIFDSVILIRPRRSDSQPAEEVYTYTRVLVQ